MAQEVPELSEEKQFKENEADYGQVAVLETLNEVFIKQPFRFSQCWKQVCCGCDVNNLYKINKVEADGQTITPLWSLQEDSSFCGRQMYYTHTHSHTH